VRGGGGPGAGTAAGGFLGKNASKNRGAPTGGRSSTGRENLLWGGEPSRKGKEKEYGREDQIHQRGDPPSPYTIGGSGREAKPRRSCPRKATSQGGKFFTTWGHSTNTQDGGDALVGGRPLRHERIGERKEDEEPPGGGKEQTEETFLWSTFFRKRQD